MATERYPLNGWQIGGNARTRRRMAFTPQQFRRPYGESTIARSEFFGAAQGGDHPISALGVATTTAFGSAALAARLSAIGVGTTSAFGAAGISARFSLLGWASASPFGLSTLQAAVLAVGISGSAPMGVGDVAAELSALGLLGITAVGQQALAARLDAVALGTSTAHGSLGIAGTVANAGGAVGNSWYGTLGLGAEVSAQGIGFTAVFGTPAVQVQATSESAPAKGHGFVVLGFGHLARMAPKLRGGAWGAEPRARKKGKDEEERVELAGRERVAAWIESDMRRSEERDVETPHLEPIVPEADVRALEFAGVLAALEAAEVARIAWGIRT